MSGVQAAATSPSGVGASPSVVGASRSAAGASVAAGRPEALDPTSFPITPRAWSEARAASGHGDEVGDGPFGRAVTAFAWGAGLTALLATANLPLVAAALLLRPDPSLAWLVAAAALPLGPALSAGLYAVRAHYLDPDLPVARAFGRGYRVNWRDASAVWLPVCLLGAVVALVGAGGRDAGVPALATGLAPGAGVVVLVVALHALALRTFFRLRATDVARAAAYYLVARWRTSLGILLLAAGAVAVAALASDLLLALLAGVWVWLWYRTAAALLRDAADRFLTGPAAGAPARPLDTSRDLT